MNHELKMRIILENPTAAVDYGLQKGSGHHYETVQTQQSGNKDLHFDFVIKILMKNKTQPNFAGPFVQDRPLKNLSTLILANVQVKSIVIGKED